MEFYFVIALLIAVSFVVILSTILRKPAAVSDFYAQRIRRNIAIFKQRESELKAELADEYITAADYQRFYADSARQLLIAVEQFEKAPAASRDHKTWLWFFLALPLLALVIYAFVGAYPDWLIAQNIQGLGNATSEQEYGERLDALYQRVDERLQQRPDQIEYRIMLARNAMSRKDYATAVSHYAIVAELLPEDADALAFYAQAEYLREGRRITARVAEYLDKALKINPFQTTALGLLGIAAFEEEDMAGAIEAWQKLSQVLDPESQQAQMIQQGISEAKSRIAAASNGTIDSVVGTADVAADKSGIRVAVNVAAALNDLDSRLSVFIYAKAANGPPMPLAVKKLTLADLPIEVTLTDAMAMMPQMRLSQFDKVIVGARVSFSGRPIPEAGDWQAESEAFDWKANTSAVSLTIADAVQ